MSWSPQQEQAIKVTLEWIRSPTSAQIFRIFGFAGTGKTTLAKTLAESVRGTVLYGAFTGKAALQLRKKGCEGASTLHSLIYSPEQNERTGEVKFLLNKDSPLADAKLLVVDEVSMVDEALAKDLMSFGVKILVLGDPAQLPPVKGEGFFINAEPDVMLTEVHRQAQDNPIIRMSMAIREGRPLERGTYGESLVVARENMDPARLRQLVLDADQIICGLNRTRTAFNARVRTLKNLVGVQQGFHPVPGDRLICLRNDRERNLFNGGFWTVDRTLSMRRGLSKVGFELSSLDEERPPVGVKVFEEFFCGKEGDLDWKRRRECQEFTFGWAITCHKSQGSQFDNVVVFDESRVFRDAWSNWAYTAITRAAEKITVVQ